MKNQLTQQDIRIGGLPRQRGTVKTMLLEKIFPDPEWGSQTDEAIANWIGVSRSHVSRCRRDYEKTQQKAREPKKESEPKGEATTEPETEAPPPPEKPVLDSVGHEVPEHLIEVFSRVPEVKEHIKLINRLFRVIKKAVEDNDPLYANCKLQRLKADIGNLRQTLRFTLPFAVCRFCGGDVNNEYCRACGGRGFVNELTYIASPKELK